MALNRPRLITALSLLAAYPLALLVSTAGAEDRKFVVFLADPSKDHPNSTLQLPKRTDIWDAYFDKVKNGQEGSVRIDSHAEWWEEVSYGDVTVSGEVFGWVSVPWPTSPTGFDGDTGFGSTSVIPHIDLQGGDTYDPPSGAFSNPFFQGEGFNPGATKFQYDIDGVGEDANRNNRGPSLMPGFDDVDNFNNSPIWAQGERFVDLNGNGAYDAGVFEWGIDKNNDGIINVDRPAGSFQQLIAANINYPPDGAPDDQVPLFIGWSNDSEWFDANGDGVWNQDHLFDDETGRQFVYLRAGFPLDDSVGGGVRIIDFYRGDWGGREIGFDRDGDFIIQGRAESLDQNNQNNPATFWEFLQQVFDPNEDTVEYFDEQWNDNFDFPEPFEDFMRRWSAGAHDFVRTSDQYVLDNYPGNAAGLNERTGNGRYNSPDGWSNNGQVNSTNKLQQAIPLLLAADEAAEQNRRGSFRTGAADSGGGTPLWWNTFWAERYGTDTPSWNNRIPYMRKFDPGTPIPQLRSQDTQPLMPFEPNRGGPFHTGRKFDGTAYTRDDGTVKPSIGDRNDGMYDGPPEFDDLPSSIYHSEGDQNFGAITSPANNAPYGQDLGSGPGGASPDGIIEAAGPLAFNVHGIGGFDAGNVLTTEFQTWRTDGQSYTDLTIDTFFGPWRIYHRDTNLDGLLDLGETVGDAGDFALPDAVYENYGADANPGTTPDGGPQSEYPFNRLRLGEDVVAALDSSTDWDEFLNPNGGRGSFGDVISGVILLPSGTSSGMFSLPAASWDLAIRVRDGLTDNQVIRRDQYNPIAFFNGLGISLSDDGEGDLFSGQGFHTAFSAHEYGHSWEGFPDLYDYDVWLRSFPGAIINAPIGRWCVMAGGGLVHPVPPLKLNAAGGGPWIEPVDITTALNPLAETTIEFRSWEFDRDKTVYVYDNPLPVTGAEQFYFWRQSAVATNPDTRVTEETFDKNLPGPGFMILHLDNQGNPDGLPTQQRLSGHFTWLIVQADGLHHLERDNTTNTGDAGDPWPGTSGATQWTRLTDPNNKWYTDEGSGLDITNIVEQGESTFVTFGWTPRELPSFSWVQPPGGTSVSGNYTLRYFAFDQHGGTTIQFFVDSDTTGFDGTLLTTSGKAPGDVDGAQNVFIGDLPNGTYSFYAKLVPGQGASGFENSVSVPRPSLNNEGDGTLQVTNADINGQVSLLEVWTVVATDDTARNRELWSVTGSVSGLQSGLAQTGQVFEADQKLGTDGQMHSPLRFTLVPDSKRFRRGDQFTFVTTGFTAYSESVLIFEGEVVEPQPPVAVIDSVDPVSGLSSWTEFTFRSGSFDPAGADFSEQWTFGDGSGLPGLPAASAVAHTYQTAGDFTVTLTVTNSFGLQANATRIVSVEDPAPPFARASASPIEGRAPLAVTLDGSASADQNDPALGGSNLTWEWFLGNGTVLDPENGTPATGDVEVLTGPARGPFDVIFNKPGRFVVTMKVTNGFGRTSSALLDVQVAGPPPDKAPVAVIEASRRMGSGPLEVDFDASASFDPEGGLLDFVWNFGDGTPLVRGVSTVSHTFTRARTYNATLTVTDSSNLKDSATLAIVVTDDEGSINTSPVASIIASSVQGPAPFAVDFDASGSSDPEGSALSYAWDFGDGSAPAFGPLVSHTYTEARNYSVVLQVRDSDGAIGATAINISVTLPSGDASLTAPPVNGGGNSVQPASPCGLFGMFPIMLTLAGMVAMRRRYGNRIVR